MKRLRIKIPDKGLVIIYLAAIVCVVALMLFMGPWFTPDSPSYVSAWEDSLQKGHPDIWRTPVYPIFLGLLQAIFGAPYLKIAIIVQNLVFLVSLYFLYDVLRKVSSNGWIPFCLTLFYALYPGVVNCNNVIMTESLAMSLMIFLIHSLFSIMTQGSWRWRSVAVFGLSLFLLVFLRPAQIYILPALLVALGAVSLTRKYRKNLKGWLPVVGAVGVLFFFYVMHFHASFGIYSSSGISTVNQFFIARDWGLITEDNVHNPEVGRCFVVDKWERPAPEGRGFRETKRFYADEGKKQEMFERGGLLYKEAYDAIDAVGLAAVQDEVHHSIQDNPRGWAKSVWGRFRLSLIEPLFYPTFNVLRFEVWFLYLLMLLIAALICVDIVRARRLPWFMLTLYLMAAGNIVLVIVGAQNDWGRLCLPSVSQVLIMLGAVADSVRYGKKK